MRARFLNPPRNFYLNGWKANFPQIQYGFAVSHVCNRCRLITAIAIHEKLMHKWHSAENPTSIVVQLEIITRKWSVNSIVRVASCCHNYLNLLLVNSRLRSRSRAPSLSSRSVPDSAGFARVNIRIFAAWSSHLIDLHRYRICPVRKIHKWKAGYFPYLNHKQAIYRIDQRLHALEPLNVY
jgi:hypothetical protein